MYFYMQRFSYGLNNRGIIMAKYKYKVVDGRGGSFSIPLDSKFYLKYEKGTTVKAPKGTLGIMVFPNFKAAEHFISVVCHNRFSTSSANIKKVLPIGSKTTPEWVSGWTAYDEKLKAFNKIPLEERCNNFLCSQAPVGTECYPKVIVID
jgi:hypothetical protein